MKNSLKKKSLFGFIFIAILMSSVSAKTLSPARQKVLETALSLGGTPYKWGGTTPDGFDCSGFVQYVFKKAIGMNLPRTADEMYDKCKIISPSERETGDLMFFTSGGRISHVGIYCGKYKNNKDPNSRLNGKVVFISAMSEGDHKGVKIADIEARYWKTHFYCYGRLLPPSPSK